jgi:acyl-coenzyme A thioesterase PaaI-like protein
LSREECVYEYTASASHFNPNKILHGGALYSVMDSSQGAFVHFVLDPKYRYAATGTATIRYEAPITEGTARIRTWLRGQEGRKLFVSSEACDENNKLLASLEEIWIAIA